MTEDPIRIILTDKQSEILRAAGIRFAVVHPGSYPTNSTGYHLDLIACDFHQADAACQVAMGTRKAGRLITHPQEATGAP